MSEDDDIDEAALEAEDRAYDEWRDECLARGIDPQAIDAPARLRAVLEKERES
jgi:hypothetical protein